MIVIYVRHNETKEFLGIFWAETHDELWWQVDQFGDPADYEWCRTGRRGGALKVEGKVSTEKYRHDAKYNYRDDYSLTVHLDEGATNDLLRPKWKQFDFFDVGHGGLAQIKRSKQTGKES